MASIEKYTHSAVSNIIRHCNREIRNNSNKDIDNTRTHLNYKLSPERKISDYEYYKHRKSKLYCYNRKDVKTMCAWVITAPHELQSREEERVFFQATYDFLERMYGSENVINAVVHYDEAGQPHLHFNFIPVAVDNNKKHNTSEKICAKDIINKTTLKNFHFLLDRHLKAMNIKGDVVNGVTKKQGGNRRVEDMKRISELERENKRLHEILYSYEHDRERNDSRWR